MDKGRGGVEPHGHLPPLNTPHASSHGLRTLQLISFILSRYGALSLVFFRIHAGQIFFLFFFLRRVSSCVCMYIYICIYYRPNVVPPSLRPPSRFNDPPRGPKIHQTAINIRGTFSGPAYESRLWIYHFASYRLLLRTLFAWRCYYSLYNNNYSRNLCNCDYYSYKT